MAKALTDTIAVSDSLVREFTSQTAYDYNRELVQTDTNYLDSFLQWLGELLDEVLGRTVGEVQYNPNYYFIWWILGAIIVVLLTWWLLQSHFALFRRDDDTEKLDYDVQLDNIHEIDFDSSLAEARRNGDYRQVCRLLYLQTLKRLSDGQVIDWQPFKTPSQYAREVADPNMRAMTNAFLCVRYGNFQATDGLCHQMAGWQDQLLASVAATAEKRGGEQQ